MTMPLHPSREAFQALAAAGHNTIPVWTEIVGDTLAPVAAFARLGTKAPSFLLESAEHTDHVGSHSFLGAGARWVLTARGGNVELEGIPPGGGSSRRITLPAEGDPLAELERLLGHYRAAPDPRLPPFQGGAVGFLSYDAIRWFEPTVGEPPPDDLGLPEMQFVLADSALLFEHRTRRLKLLAVAFTEDGPQAYDLAAEKIQKMLAALAAPVSLPPLFPGFAAPLPPAAANTSREDYLEMVLRAKEYIRAGDIFQVVPSLRLEAPFASDALALYRALRFINPSPYMFCLRCPGGFEIVGSSPEVHVRVCGRLAEIRPIAGTRRRGETPEEDAANAEDLLADPKERAEHIMLVDLARNDLGRVCEFGSVRVSDFMTIERYSHVMHIVSHVCGRLSPSRNAFDALRATFPAGTVTGAPKIRAMQILNSLEKSRRGIYAGAVGYIGFDGRLDSCIALRTALLRSGKAYVQAGAGVVADSSPEAEYQECLNKARAALRAIALASTLPASPA